MGKDICPWMPILSIASRMELVFNSEWMMYVCTDELMNRWIDGWMDGPVGMVKDFLVLISPIFSSD